MAALFIIAKMWKQLRCPSVGEWINYGYIQIIESYLVLKKAIMPWKDIEKTWKILLKERSQSEKAKYCRIPTIRHSGKG